MSAFTIGHLPKSSLPHLRPVALAYRRANRCAKAEGLRPELMHHKAHEAAVAEYLARIGESASLTRIEAATRVAEMIAAAIRVNPQWYWHGPDA